MSVALIAALVAGAVPTANPSQTPPPLVETRQPDSGVIDAVWRGRGGDAPGLVPAAFATQQAPPPSPVEYDPPQRSVVSMTHDCPGQRLEISYEARGWTSRDGAGIVLTRYRSDAGPMSLDQLAAWNEELRKLHRFRFFEVECQAGDRVAVRVIGGDITGAEARVLAFIDQGRVRFARPGNGAR